MALFCRAKAGRRYFQDDELRRNHTAAHYGQAGIGEMQYGFGGSGL